MSHVYDGLMSPLLLSPLKPRLCGECQEICTVTMLRMITMFGMNEAMDITCCVSGRLSKLKGSPCKAFLSVS